MKNSGRLLITSSARPHVSLVADLDDQVVGHIFFLSPVTIDSTESVSAALGLAPMAVLPNDQRRGIGSQLVLVGLRCCQRIGHRVVVVLGHPHYYPRFGFTLASHHGLRGEYNVPDEVFIVAESESGALAGRRGLVKYHPAFQNL